MIRLQKLAALALLWAAISTTACTKENTSAHTIIQGTVPSDTERLSIKYQGEWVELATTKDGTFVDTLMIDAPQYVFLSVDDFSIRVYATPGHEVGITLDSILSFSGSNVVINDYLYEYYQNDHALNEAEFHGHKWFFSQEEADYIQYRDSIKTAWMTHLAELPPGTEAFQEFHEKDIEYRFHYDVARYPNYHSSYFNDYEPTDLIMDYYAGVPLDNDLHAKNYSGYLSLIDLILDKKIKEATDTTLSPLEQRIAVLKEIQSPAILHSRLRKALFYFTVNDKDMEGMRDQMLSLAKLDRTKEVIKKHYEVISKLKPGTPSPVFDYENHAGGKTALTDLKGKYIFIDLWATWCSPCIREIPHLKELEEELHDANIEFVSISLDEAWSEGTWRKMVREEALVGTQLLADDGWGSAFVKEYGVQGIPHFIIVDDQGKIVSANAEPPSNPALKKRLLALGL